MINVNTTMSDHRQDDVQGFVVPLVVAGALAFGYGMMIGGAVTTTILNANEAGTLKAVKPLSGAGSRPGGGRS